MNPIRLAIEEKDSAVNVQVLGSSERPYAGSFELQVAGNGNQSTHRGSASIEAGELVTLSNVTLAGVTGWSAHLTVTSADGASYDESASGPN